ncbi:hypothetical protein PWT90_11212 [Aphanocladium album]|nr:hypothetical protein PWT90_11212 [Aphanocladium album]
MVPHSEDCFPGSSGAATRTVDETSVSAWKPYAGCDFSCDAGVEAVGDRRCTLGDESVEDACVCVVCERLARVGLVRVYFTSRPGWVHSGDVLGHWLEAVRRVLEGRSGRQLRKAVCRDPDALWGAFGYYSAVMQDVVRGRTCDFVEHDFVVAFDAGFHEDADMGEMESCIEDAFLGLEVNEPDRLRVALVRGRQCVGTLQDLLDDRVHGARSELLTEMGDLGVVSKIASGFPRSAVGGGGDSKGASVGAWEYQPAIDEEEEDEDGLMWDVSIVSVDAEHSEESDDE